MEAGAHGRAYPEKKGREKALKQLIYQWLQYHDQATA